MMIKVSPGTYVWGVTRHEYNFDRYYYKFFRTREEARAWLNERTDNPSSSSWFNKSRVEKITVWVEKYK